MAWIYALYAVIEKLKITTKTNWNKPCNSSFIVNNVFH